MIRVLAVGFAPEPGRAASAAQQALAVLRVEGWTPPGAALRMLTAPCAWWGATDAIAEASGAADVVMMFAATPGHAALVQKYARNEADPDRADALGLRWPGAVLAPGSPHVLPASLRADALAAAIRFSGLDAKAAADGCRYVANRAFYELRAQAPAKPIGLVLLPLSLEAARREGVSGGPTRLDILGGVRAALSFAAAAAELGRAA